MVPGISYWFDNVPADTTGASMDVRLYVYGDSVRLSALRSVCPLWFWMD
jgi:hypothetical protein